MHASTIILYDIKHYINVFFNSFCYIIAFKKLWRRLYCAYSLVSTIPFFHLAPADGLKKGQRWGFSCLYYYQLKHAVKQIVDLPERRDATFSMASSTSSTSEEADLKSIWVMTTARAHFINMKNLNPSTDT